MNAVAGTVRKAAAAASRAVTMTTEAAGALGGAVVNGTIGGVKGAARGAQRGLSAGSHSTPAAALALGTLGVAGLVEWPVLLVVGGTALAIKQFKDRSANGATPAGERVKTPTGPAGRAPKTATAKAAGTKPAGAAPAKSAPSQSTPAKRSAASASTQPKKTTTQRARGATNSSRDPH